MIENMVRSKVLAKACIHLDFTFNENDLAPGKNQFIINQIYNKSNYNKSIYNNYV